MVNRKFLVRSNSFLGTLRFLYVDFYALGSSCDLFSCTVSRIKLPHFYKTFSMAETFGKSVYVFVACETTILSGS